MGRIKQNKDSTVTKFGSMQAYFQGLLPSHRTLYINFRRRSWYIRIIVLISFIITVDIS